MAVFRFFGLPGCGKTTVLARFAYKLRKRYRFVYSNVHLNIPDVIYVPFDKFGEYELMDGVYLVDEATVNCGDRDYKNFSKAKLKYAMEHRHHRLDIFLFSQEPDGTDKKLRSITDRCFYVKKGFWTRSWLTSVYRVPYKVLWPNGEHDGGENAGRILMGYVKPPWWSRLFAIRVIRPRWYKYFDSWECDRMKPLPDAGDDYLDVYNEYVMDS